MMMPIKIKGTIVSNDDKWIYDFCEIEATCPKDIENALAESEGDVTVEINSGGGDVFAGNEIGYKLNQYKGKVTADITGFCGSAATIIACYCNEVRALPSALYMVHNVASGGYGDYHAHDKQSEILQTANKAISHIYQQKTGKSEKDLLKIMDKETWMSAKEAQDEGFVDSIIGDDGAMPFTINNSFATILSDETKQKIRNMQIEQNGKEGTSDSAIFMQSKLNLLKMKGEFQ